jgi:hypothetical protein
LVVEVHFQVASLDHRLGVALRAPHDRVDPGHKLVFVERLRQVIVGAEAEAPHLVLYPARPDSTSTGVEILLREGSSERRVR